MRNLTIEELGHCDKPLTDDWKNEFNYAGSFQTVIMQAIGQADEINLLKLSQVYPNLVNLYRKFTGK